MEEKTCCVTGSLDIPAEWNLYIERELRREVMAAIENGYTRFISGFSKEVDFMFAAAVMEQRKRNKKISLEAALPYKNRLKTKNQRFQQLLCLCSDIKIMSESYAPSCFMQCNRYLVRQSRRVIAVYDGQCHGGTLFTMRLAHTMDREVRVIWVPPLVDGVAPEGG